jgi:hypothetical protein
MALALGAAGANNALVARNVALLNGVKEAVENAGGRGPILSGRRVGR